VRRTEANMIDKSLDTGGTAMLTSRRLIYLAVLTVGLYHEALLKAGKAANNFNRKIRWSRR